MTREVDPVDRRRVLVRPTGKGREEWDKHNFEGMARERKLLGALTYEELVRLNALLRKVLRSPEH